jgi:hypothetical protein
MRSPPTSSPRRGRQPHRQTILRGRYDGGFDKTSLPDDVILTNSFTVGDGRIVTLIIIAPEPATTP